jgi:hypothetical protein
MCHIACHGGVRFSTTSVFYRQGGIQMHVTSSKRWIRTVGLSLVVAGGSASADAGYQDTTQITGGALVQMLRSIPFMPKSTKQVLEPMVTTIELRGNQLARVATMTTEIIDLDRETITRTDNDRKTYTVTTFDDMRQALKEVSKSPPDAKNGQNEPAAGTEPRTLPQYKVTFDIAVVDTGTSKSVNGLLAKEQILSMKARVTPVDPRPADQGQSVTYSVITDIWSAPEPPEMRAVDDFYVRYGKKLAQGVDSAATLKSMQSGLNQSAMSSLFASQPGMSAAMPDMLNKIAVEMEKIKGVRVLTITRIGGEGMAAPSVDATTVTAAAGKSGSGMDNVGNVAVKQVAADTTSAAVSEQTNKLGTVGSAFGSSVVSVFRRALAPTANAAPAPDAKGGQSAGSDAVFYEMTTQKGSFSPDPVSATFFQIPAGYIKVESSRTPTK